MPRSRGLEAPQRQSPRGVMQPRTSSSDSDQSHKRAIPDRSPKAVNRCSPRSVQSDSPKQKKLGTRIADLESQLGQAQDELKNLKDQLRSAKAAENDAQEELESKIQKPTDSSSKNQQETEFFEVQVENVALEPEKPILEDLDMKNDEIALLKSELHEKENALALLGKENEDLKSQLEEAGFNLSSAESKGEEMASRAKKLGEELEASKETAFHLQETVTSLEGAKQALEAEMKKLRVQTEQWRKAADAAAAVLADSVDMNGRVSDKHFGGYNGFVGSPGMAEDSDDGFGSEKRKGSRTRMFGDLWRKKGQK